MDITGIAASGLDRAQTAFTSAAAKLGSPTSSEDSVSLSDNAVALIQAKDSFSANTAVLKAADQIERTAIGLVG